MSIHDGEHDTAWDGLSPPGDAVDNSPVRDTRLGSLLDASLGQVEPRDPELFLRSLDQIRGGGNGIPRAPAKDSSQAGQGRPGSAACHPGSPTQSQSDGAPWVQRRQQGNGPRQRMAIMMASAGLLGMAAMVSMMLIQWPRDTRMSRRQIPDAAKEHQSAPEMASGAPIRDPRPGSPVPIASLATTEPDLGPKSTSNEIAAALVQVPSTPSPVDSKSVAQATVEIPVAQSRPPAPLDTDAFVQQPSPSRDSDEVRASARHQLMAGAGAPRFRPASPPKISSQGDDSSLRADGKVIQLEAAPASASMSVQSPGMDGPPAPTKMARGERTLGSVRFVTITQDRERSAAHHATTGTAVNKLAGTTTTTLPLIADNHTTNPIDINGETDEPRLQH